MSLRREPGFGSVSLIHENVDDRPAEDELRSKWDLMVHTAPFFSLQLTWSVQQVFGIPYLSSLGIPDAQIPLLVISGPVAGIVVPPIVAALSEIIESPLGKRMPFIFAGGCGTILSFLFLAAAKPISESISYMLFGSDSNQITMAATHIVAGVSMYALNFSIQPLSLGLRASVVDHFGPLQQSDANLWISRFSSLGSIFVALLGLSYSPEFYVLCTVVSACIGIMLAVVAVTGVTGPLECESITKRSKETIRTHFNKILKRAGRLPSITRWTCQVQLVSWVAWFFVLNYTSVLVSRLYRKSGDSTEETVASATSHASPERAVAGIALLFHCSSLLALILVSRIWGDSSSPPSLPPQGEQEDNEVKQATINHPDHEINKAGVQVKRVNFRLSETSEQAYEPALKTYGNAILQNNLEGEIYKRRNHLARTLWRPALLILATSVLGITVLVAVAPYASASIIVASMLLGANGALFGLSNWVPYSLIAYEAAIRAQSRDESTPTWQEEPEHHSWVDEESLVETEDAFEEDGDDAHTDDTPVLLAVHQVAMTLPQVVAGIVSSLLMQVLEMLGVQQSVCWIFALSVPAAVWAACL